ncbi:MAG: type II toxin-antitoxin system RelE/ParE family toxin, partial [Acaryochloridaceae cyanobacterium RU_4_10]|nr:type II toxin-antitoxin system RelE/ParE family toxin [Acaryochloridaceae cyanobacterium RU_4_10]
MARIIKPPVLPENDTDNKRTGSFRGNHSGPFIKPYRIVYRVEEDKKRISIARFWHSSQK